MAQTDEQRRAWQGAGEVIESLTKRLAAERARSQGLEEALRALHGSLLGDGEFTWGVRLSLWQIAHNALEALSTAPGAVEAFDWGKHERDAQSGDVSRGE